MGKQLKHSKASTYHRKGLWAIKKKHGGKFPQKAAAMKKRPQKIVKKTKKGERTVVRPRPARINEPEPDRLPSTPRRRVRTPSVRKSLQPGVVAILLAGKHAGRRVVVVRTLPSGLIVVSGPRSLSRVGIKRVNPAYVIATSTKLDLSASKEFKAIGKKLNDPYFTSTKLRMKKKRSEGTPKKLVFDEKARQRITALKEQLEKLPKGSEERKKVVLAKEKERRQARAAARALIPHVALQKEVDSILLKAIEPNPLLKSYIRSKFALPRGQYPHQLKF